MRADWLLMKDVRDDLAKLRARLYERTGSHEVYETLLLDIWDSVCRAIEDERAVNGGTKRYGLRTDKSFRPEVPFGSHEWGREMSAKNYVGRPSWDILVDRVAREKLGDWTAPSAHVERRISEFRRREEARTREPSSPPQSSPSS